MVVMAMNNLRMVREARGMTQQAVADYLNITRVSYARYEGGQRQPDLETVRRLAALYRVSVDELLGQSRVDAGTQRPYLETALPSQRPERVDLSPGQLYKLRRLLDAGLLENN